MLRVFRKKSQLARRLMRQCIKHSNWPAFVTLSAVVMLSICHAVTIHESDSMEISKRSVMVVDDSPSQMGKASLTGGGDWLGMEMARQPMVMKEDVADDCYTKSGPWLWSRRAYSGKTEALATGERVWQHKFLSSGENKEGEASNSIWLLVCSMFTVHILISFAFVAAINRRLRNLPGQVLDVVNHLVLSDSRRFCESREPPHRKQITSDSADDVHAMNEDVGDSKPRSIDETNTFMLLGIQRYSANKTLEPVELLDRLLCWANLQPGFVLKPSRPVAPWTLGVGTVKGNVRTENQDYAFGFEVGKHQVLIIADGLGGLKYGQLASNIAVKSAAVSIIRRSGLRSDKRPKDVADIAAKALTVAGHNVAVEGDKLNVSHTGLRTTLIVIVADESVIGYAYIGDGGGCIVRTSGEILHFLKPQKADPNSPNILAASLGPCMEGEPVVGKLDRKTDDLVIVGTDGVFDRLEEKPERFPVGTNQFVKDVVKGAFEFSGDLQGLTDRVLGEMAGFKDSHGFICNDNMSLGLIGCGEQPNLHKYFWDVATNGNRNEKTTSEIWEYPSV
jgi:serine/threonine protein phosphatase PrpC